MNAAAEYHIPSGMDLETTLIATRGLPDEVRVVFPSSHPIVRVPDGPTMLAKANDQSSPVGGYTLGDVRAYAILKLMWP